MKKSIEFLFLIIFLMPLFNYLEFGWSWDSHFKIIYPFSLSIITTLNILFSNLRNISLKLSLILLTLMVLLYFVNRLEWGSLLGSFGFAILIVVVCTYIPNLIKEGHI